MSDPNVEIEQRFKVLEERVDALMTAMEQILAILEADPVAASFRRFQRNADKQMGRG